MMNLMAVPAVAETPPVSGWQPKPGVIEARGKRRTGINFDGSRVPECQLPDPLASEDGRPITPHCKQLRRFAYFVGQRG